MTSDSSLDIRVVRFLPAGTAAEYDAMPEEVRDEADAATTLLQNDRLPANAECLKGALKGITEIRIDHDTNTYRVYYFYCVINKVCSLTAFVADQTPAFVHLTLLTRLDSRRRQARSVDGRSIIDTRWLCQLNG